MLIFINQGHGVFIQNDSLHMITVLHNVKMVLGKYKEYKLCFKHHDRDTVMSVTKLCNVSHVFTGPLCHRTMRYGKDIGFYVKP
jgi:hypothetical protein